MLDSQIVTFNLKELPVNTEGWYTSEIMDLTGAGGYEDNHKKKNRQKRSKKKIIYSTFPLVEKLNKEGNKEAIFLKCLQVMHKSD